MLNMIRKICHFISATFLRIKKRVVYIAFKFSTSECGSPSVFYFLFSNAFKREHIGVLRGIAHFKSEKGQTDESSALLRRNIHRIEKGLIMRPRRNLFALGYIAETFKAFKIAVKQPINNNYGELSWARDVLTAYFEACGQHELIDELRREFSNLPALNSRCKAERASAFKPYKRNLDAPQPVNFEHLLSLAKHRRSVRWFLPKPVPRVLIEKAVHLAALSPSACNRQPFEFRFFDDPELLWAVSKLPGGTAGYEHNFSLIGVVIGNLANFFDERDRHLIYIDGSLATMSLLFALESLGLSSCCINWPDSSEREEKAKKLLGLTEYERPVMFLAIGYPDPEGMVPYSQKKPTSQLCRWNYRG